MGQLPLPSGKRLQKNYGTSPFLMGKVTISTGPFSMSQTVTNYQRVNLSSSRIEAH